METWHHGRYGALMSEDPRTTVDVASKIATRLALLLCTDGEVHDLAECWLAAAGMHVISASSAQEATRRIVEERIDVLVLDTLPIYLPGLPSLLELKQERPHFHVILISRLDEKPEVSIARISGVDAVLDRPLTRAKLLSVVDGLG
jgi:DNA-binding response OmpR family regulator